VNVTSIASSASDTAETVTPNRTGTSSERKRSSSTSCRAIRDIVTNGGSPGPSTFICGISATLPPSGRIMSIAA